MRALSASIFLFTASMALAQAQQQPPASPFDSDDPEIAKIRSLDWKSADFNSLDERSRAAALQALNRGLFDIGAKADARLDLLTDYLDKEDLGPTFASTADTLPPKTPPTYEDMLKVAAAYIKTPAGAARIGDTYKDSPPELIKNYVNLYDKSARREYAETAESRANVRLMAIFLQNQGKLDDFKTWSAGERKRRQEEHQQRMAADKTKSDQAAADRQKRVEAASDERHKRLEAQQQAARQMAAALQQQSYAGDEPAIVYGDDVIVSDYGGYYYSNAYRGAVRDRVQNAYGRWQSRAPAHLPAAAGLRGGGGARGGGGRGR